MSVIHCDKNVASNEICKGVCKNSAILPVINIFSFFDKNIAKASAKKTLRVERRQRISHRVFTANKKSFFFVFIWFTIS